MTISEIMPTIRSLQHSDKFLLMNFLLHEIAKEEDISLDAIQVNQVNEPKTIDALQSIAKLAQPLGPENLARNFDHYIKKVDIR